MFLWLLQRCLQQDYIALNDMLTDGWIGRDLEGNSFGLIEILFRHLLRWAVEKPRKPPVRIASVSADIQTEHLRILISERYHYARPVRAVMCFVCVESMFSHCELTDSHLTQTVAGICSDTTPGLHMRGRKHAIARATYILPYTTNLHKPSDDKVKCWELNEQRGSN